MTVLTIPVTADDHIQGSLKAACTLLEYGDYECPHCGAAYPVIKQLQKHFGKRICFVFRNFPLTQMHPNAQIAAETAEFAGAQGKFWEMHDLLFENQQDLETAGLKKLVKKLGLSAKAFSTALETHEYQPRVRADFVGGVRSGVNGTPTLFLNGTRLDIQPDYELLLEAINGALGSS